MTAIFPLLMFVILFACVAMCYTEGMWSNAIRLVNIVMAGLLAMNFFEPVVRWLVGLGDWWKSCTYVWDFLVLWGLFAVFMVIFRELTSYISPVKVRFLGLADRIGSGVFALWIGWVMVCFTMTTLHAAPLSRTFLFDGFQPEERMLFGLAPDRQWLGFTQRMSMGAFSTSDQRVFDPTADFMPKYATRRHQLEDQIKRMDSIRTP